MKRSFSTSLRALGLLTALGAAPACLDEDQVGSFSSAESDVAVGDSDNDSAPDPAVCGNGELEGDEECDDGNRSDFDGCDSQCEVEPNNDDDSGDDPPGDSTDSADDASEPDAFLCGNGVLDEGEECDDGNRSDFDGCDSQCREQETPGATNLCGNGELDDGEECDDGNRSDFDLCSSACLFEGECGDGTRGLNEECDDGNLIGGDGCDAACLFESTVPCFAVSAEPLPATLQVIADAVTSAGGGTTAPAVTTQTMSRNALFNSFNQSCGLGGGAACHVGTFVEPTVVGGLWQVLEDTFEQRPNIGTEALEFILHPDPAVVMPPGGGPGNNRPCTDPMHTLGRQLEAWQEANHPDSFEYELCPEEIVDDGDDDASAPEGCDVAQEPYRMSAEVAAAQTNIGSCVLPAVPLEARAEPGCGEAFLRAKDQIFAQAETSDDLPLTLRETDFVSLDSEVLLRHEVYSYAPTYTLFSDNAKKQRYVRVPVGQAITYNEANNDLDFPDNTRFYKTFLKKVTDSAGNERYRKMETRLIVTRKDETLADGTFAIRSLRATYVWDKEERTARLLRDPLRNGEAWADRLCPFIVDENQTRDPVTNPIINEIQFDDGSCSMGACTYMTNDECENFVGQVRHYALPSKERCDQCHMGANNRSYILGFNPWQVDRRPAGEGGVYDTPDPTADELNQLERFLAYGIVAGLEPGEAKLEESQPGRPPRNHHELTAQAYMLGNCAFCHNPNGFPSVTNEELVGFNLYPGEISGGAFQFPLDQTSNRVRLGGATGEPVPYIDPGFGNPHGTTPKVVNSGIRSLSSFDPNVQPGESPLPEPFPRDVAVSVQTVGEVEETVLDASGALELLGPWNSLIWRNVYSPFTYGEDGTIFVHMPRHVPGYDCRLHKIMAQWMLSVPAATTTDDVSGREVVARFDSAGNPGVTELFPGDPGYEDARAAGLQRALDYLDSVTGQHCPPDEDIVEALTINSSFELPPNELSRRRPRPADGYEGEARLYSERIDQSIDTATTMFDGVPDHAHWVPLDTTDPPGDWQARRPDWIRVLTGQDPPLNPALEPVIAEIQALDLSPELEALALSPVPMGLWADSTACATEADAANSPAADTLLAAGPTNETLWLFDQDPTAAPFLPEMGDRVHYQSRGQAIVRAICQNCHGENYDSNSPLAATISELTGGQARVANFRDGLLGPEIAPGAYAENSFTFSEGNIGGTPAEWQARYMLFMGLGGTRVQLPSIALQLVAGSPFYGQAVSVDVTADAASGNMLQSAESQCENVVNEVVWTAKTDASNQLYMEVDGRGNFVKGNAHLWLWDSICSAENERLIRVLDNNDASRSGVPGLFRQQVTPILNNSIYRSQDHAGRALYPVDSPIGTQFGLTNESGQRVLGLRDGDGNTLPWCVRTPEPDCVQAVQDFEAGATASLDADCREAYDKLLGLGVPEAAMPFCPNTLLATASDGTPLHRFPRAPVEGFNPPDIDTSKLAQQEFRESWVRRGAMNAGIAAYYYYDALSKGLIEPAVAFDDCAQLGR